MIHPDIERTIKTGYPSHVPSPSYSCEECGQEIEKGNLAINIPSSDEVLCSSPCMLKYLYDNDHLDWVVDLMLEEGTLLWRVAE